MGGGSSSSSSRRTRLRANRRISREKSKKPSYDKNVTNPVIWYDTEFDETLTVLQEAVNKHTGGKLYLCKNSTSYTNAFKKIKPGIKAIVVTSGTIGKTISERTGKNSRIKSLIIYCGEKSKHYEWAQEHFVIATVVSESKKLIEAVNTCMSNPFSDHWRNISFLYDHELSNPATQALIEILKKQVSSEDIDLHSAEELAKKMFGKKKGIAIIDTIIDLLDSDGKEVPFPFLSAYTCDDVYEFVNKLLRSVELKKIGEVSNILLYMIEEMRDFCTDNPDLVLKEMSTVYRGLRMEKIDISKYKVGMNITFAGFTSASKTFDVASQFSKRFAKKTNFPVIFRIQYNKVPAESKYLLPIDITDISQIDGEDEILFPLFSKFRVASIHMPTKGNPTIIDLDYLGCLMQSTEKNGNGIKENIVKNNNYEEEKKITSSNYQGEIIDFWNKMSLTDTKEQNKKSGMGHIHVMKVKFPYELS